VKLVPFYFALELGFNLRALNRLLITERLYFSVPQIVINYGIAKAKI
jgi:hypothetical protein